MLAEGLRAHRESLSASLLAEYGVDLERPQFGPWRLAELVANLPAGCAFWRSYGGPLAWTLEAHLLAAVEFRLKALEFQGAGQKGPKPKALQHPPFASEAEKSQHDFDRKARLFKERFG